MSVFLCLFSCMKGNDMEDMWVLKHVEGCGGDCYKRIGKPKETDPVVAGLFRNLDDTPILNGDPIICQSCGVGLGLNEMHPKYWEKC